MFEDASLIPLRAFKVAIREFEYTTRPVCPSLVSGGGSRDGWRGRTTTDEEEEAYVDEGIGQCEDGDEGHACTDATEARCQCCSELGPR